jgi:hypothetical protein
MEGAGMRDHDRVGIDIHHTAVGVYRLGDLMRVLPGGQPAAEIQELLDALLRQPLNGLLRNSLLCRARKGSGG